MADTKISALASIVGTDLADGDLSDVVDISDTTMAVSGTNKRTTIVDLARAIFARPLVIESSTPAAPASGVRLFGRSLAGRNLPAIVGPAGLDTSLQPLIARNKVAIITPQGNATGVQTWGIGLSTTGTGTAANWANTNLHTSMRRIDYLVTTAATTAVAGFRGAAQQFWRGNGAGLGGFTLVSRFGIATGGALSTKRAFCGMRASASAPTDVQPSSLTDIIGVGYDAADANWFIMHNDASGTATRVDTSIERPSADRQGVFEIALFCAPNSSTIGYEFTRLDTGATFSGTATTDLPVNTTALNPYAYASVGGTSSVVGITLFSLYIETDL